MTNEIKSRIDYYVSKLGTWPHVANLSSDFNVTKEKAKEYLDEYREIIKRPVMAPSPAEPTKSDVPRISKQQFDILSNKEEKKIGSNNLHETVVQHGGGIIALRIISAIVTLACVVRGFIVIVEINTVIGWQGYLNAIIFQGGSAILPIIGMLYFSLVKKGTMVFLLFGCFYIIGGLGSMMYEVYASSQVFHQTNIKQEISIQNVFTNNGDSILQSIQENINSENANMARIVSNLSKRRAELAPLSPQDLGYPAAAGRVSANLADQSKSQDNLNRLGNQKTERLKELESKSNKQSSVTNLVQNNDFVELIITLIPSIIMVVFTPVFFSIALFGVGKKE